MLDLRWIVACIAVCLAPSGCLAISQKLGEALGPNSGAPYAAEMQRFADYQERLGRGDRDGVRRDLENAKEIGALSLLLLTVLEAEAGDFDAELAALSDATEGLLRDIDLSQTVGGASQLAGPADQANMLPLLISNLASTEGVAEALANQPATHEPAQTLLFWLTEQRKGRFFDALEFDARATTPEGRRTLAELRQARAVQVAKYFKQMGDGTARAQAPQQSANGGPRDELAEKIGRLERQLLVIPANPPREVMKPYVSTGRPRSSYPKGSPSAFLAKVTAAIPADTSYVSYNRLVGGPGGPSGSDSATPTPALQPQYVALVAGASGLAHFALGDADEIDRLVDNALALIASHSSDPAQPPDAALLAALQAVHDRIWRPLLPALQGSQHVFIAGDGPIEALPFAALHNGSHWLFERTTLSHLHSARDFLAHTWSTGDGPAVVVAYPGPPAAPADPRVGAGRMPRLEAPLLQGAGSEARAVHQRLPGSGLGLDAQVTKDEILALPRPRILHIASHALYLPDQAAPQSATAGQRGIAIQSAEPNPVLDMYAHRPEEGWMRSALILAPPPGATGPDRAWAGLATAYEIMAMDLRGTQLVTLSACETGRGTVFGRHGITSLQRAFLVAGSESVLATLWRIDDRTTPDWIGAFYDALAAGHTRAQAVQDAMKAQIATRPHPYYWAAFELTGAIGPVRPATKR